MGYRKDTESNAGGGGGDYEVIDANDVSMEDATVAPQPVPPPSGKGVRSAAMRSAVGTVKKPAGAKAAAAAADEDVEVCFVW